MKRQTFLAALLCTAAAPAFAAPSEANCPTKG